ncbi:MAG: HD domain-containing protein [Bacteroidia bacterium]|nr:HD domain-containing protein [Bacteroidia bacterium]MCO5255071.1 HD domain-containing protein [Bacteroidota bacterium]MCZ2129829.1 HD domain-containing protein [Bacteroidia bacterium]
MVLKNKRKIVNDPVYGFLTLPSDLIFDLVEHPYFQRLRRIKQLGLADLVYPGATHTRFHHALGALQLMCRALDVLKQKGNEITDEEYEATCAAILLHDIGHGPFSHALEYILVKDLHHERISTLMMEKMNEEFDGKLSLCIKIFKDKYPKKYLHQLISSQLDMDRLDYLSRDSFYTGVSEGVVSADRIINMLNVKDNQLVIEEKGIYSIEKFIIARRLMYWQVYLHKAVVSADILLKQVLLRARTLANEGNVIYATPALQTFLYNKPNEKKFEDEIEVWLERFVLLDDAELDVSIKQWQFDSDKILSFLAKCYVNRHLPKIEISTHPFSEKELLDKQSEAIHKFKIDSQSVSYFIQTGILENNAYMQDSPESIKIIRKNGAVVDVTEVSDNYNLSALQKTVRKYYLCYLR